MNDTIDRPNLSEVACESIKNMIIEGRLTSGLKISEENVAKELGISRTPIKIALTKLAKEGLVDLIPRRGAFVRQYTLRDYIEIYEIREMIEGLATRLSATRITEENLTRLESLNDDFIDVIQEIQSAGEPEKHPLYMKKRKLDIEFHRTILESGGNRFLIRFPGILLIELQSFFYLNAVIPDEAHDRICQEHIDIVSAIKNHDPERAERVSRNHTVQALRLLETRMTENGDLREDGKEA